MGDQSNDFKSKISVFQRRETEKSSILLHGYILILLICLSFTTWKISSLEDNFSHLKREFYELKGKSYQKKNDIKNAEKKVDLNFNKYDWKKLLDNDKKYQVEVETDIENQIAQYLTKAKVLVSIDMPTKTLLISVVGTSSNEISGKILNQNILSIIKYFEEISYINQVSLKIVGDKEKKVVYDEIYVKEKNKFIKQPNGENKLVKGNG